MKHGRCGNRSETRRRNEFRCLSAGIALCVDNGSEA